MKNQFEWREVETVHREIRRSKHGEELRWLVNREAILNRESGEVIRRSTLRHPGICVIVPFAAPDQVVLMRQYRYSADDLLWELPAGTLEGREESARMVATESPDECARRELREETGYEAARWEKVCECYVMPGMSDELMHVYFARDLTLREPSLDIGEVIEEVRPFPLAEIEALLSGGAIRDAKTLVGLFYALRRA